MLTSNTGAEHMRNALPDRPPLSDGADATRRQARPAAPGHSRLSHLRAQRSLALLLDATTEPALAARLRQHVDACVRCQAELERLREAEDWLRQQPVEAPQMVARQDAAWAAIQARLAAEEAPQPVAEKALSNGHAHSLDHPNCAKADVLVPLVAASADSDAHAIAPSDHSLALPLPSNAEIIAHSLIGHSGILNPRRVVFVALAAALIVGSFAALFLAKFSGAADPTLSDATSLFSMGVLDPGSETSAVSFDPISRRLLTLSGAMSYNCPPGAPCPPSAPACQSFSVWDVGTGKVLDAIHPTCTTGKTTPNYATFTNLFDDSAKGEALLIDNHQQVTAVSNQSGAVLRTYDLTCCANDDDLSPDTLLDQNDQLLLTTETACCAGVSDKLVAQDALTGQFKYQTTLEGADALRSALLSSVTGWVYLWSQCGAESDASCVEVYQASSGQKVTTWQANDEETPLAADPTTDALYVRQDYSNAPSQTLVIDARSGKTVDRLPAAQAMAFNEPLHHAYLLDDDGVTVIDTITRRKLSTLPVLSHDENWLAPAVDEATNQLFVPIQRGKLLIAQDDAAGQLSLRSASLEVVLEAERAMIVDQTTSGMGLYPWELPLGPSASTVYHPMSQGTQSDCGMGWVAARSAAAVSAQGDGTYQVQISLAWDDHFANTLVGTPTSQSSYPHEHTWLYAVPVSGDAWLSSQQGAAFSHC